MFAKIGFDRLLLIQMCSVSDIPLLQVTLFEVKDRQRGDTTS